MVKGKVAKVAKVLPIEKIGEYAFLVCLLVAVIAGLAWSRVTDYQGSISLALVILGAVIGLITVTEKEVTPFLLAAVALLVANTGAVFIVINNVVGGLGTAINGVVVNIATFVAPAAIILSVKSVYALARKA